MLLSCGQDVIAVHQRCTEFRYNRNFGRNRNSVSAFGNFDFGRNEIYQLFESCCYFSVDILHLSTKSIKLTKHMVKMFSVSTYIVPGYMHYAICICMHDH
jgi:hypothetical protein